MSKRPRCRRHDWRKKRPERVSVKGTKMVVRVLYCSRCGVTRTEPLSKGNAISKQLDRRADR